MATKTETITIRVGPKLRDQLKAAAETQEMTVGEYIRTVITTHLQRQAS